MTVAVGKGGSAIETDTGFKELVAGEGISWYILGFLEEGTDGESNVVNFFSSRISWVSFAYHAFLQLGHVHVVGPLSHLSWSFSNATSRSRRRFLGFCITTPLYVILMAKGMSHHGSFY